MSRDEWRKRRRDWWFPEDFFVEFEKLSKMMEKEFERMFRKPALTWPLRRTEPYVYGFSVSVGPGGRPVVRQFGNVETGKKRPVIKREREPLVDVTTRNSEIVVLAEVPGVEEKDIKLNAADDRLTISVDTERRKYFKDLTLPRKVDPDSARANYNNGVLEVRLKRRDPTKGGREIKIQ